MARILLIAYACDAEDVSETWCSHQWVRRLAQRHDATVLVYNRRRRRGAAGAQLPGARVLEWSEPALLERLGTFNDTVKPGYAHFYFCARRAIARLLRAERFDLVHQLEPFAPRYPSPGAGLGLPLVIGPVGGAVATPDGFRDELGRGAPWHARLRAFDRARFRFDPLLRHTYRSADVVLGVAPYVGELLAGVSLRRFEILHETGVDALPLRTARPLPPHGRLSLLYVGRITRAKGVRDAIRALARLADLPGVVLDVVGDGDDRAACEREARALGVADRVHFHGWRPRDEVARFYAAADLFLFPSVREPSGTVVIEAMSHGLPLVVAANGGPGHVVDESCGVRVPPVTPRQYANELAAALRTLALAPERLAPLGHAARRKVEEEFAWDSRIEQLGALYEDVIARALSASGRLSHATGGAMLPELP
jgi:glycosyltransferase involved in cell wall biosynthesis